jgi:cytochrome b involved in lipid metabolism
MNYKTLLLGAALIIVAVYSVYATVTPMLEKDSTDSSATNSMQNEVSTSTEMVLENQSSDSVGDESMVGNPEVMDSELATEVSVSPVIPTQTPTASTPTAPAPVPQPVPEAVMATSYTLAEVAKHSTEKDCWTAVNGMVYDLTSFIARHPGGKSNIMRICGIDGTAVFERQHGGQGSPENTLAGLEIGVLK